MSDRVISGELLEKGLIDLMRKEEVITYHIAWNDALRHVLMDLRTGMYSPPAPCEVEGLLPCPLPSCGGEADLGRAFGNPYYVHSIECMECGICLSVTSTGETPPQSLFNLWNTRQPSGSGWLPKDEPAIKYCEHGVPYAIPCDECFPPQPPQEVNNG